MMLPLKLIRRDGGTQPRVVMDLETVARYARDLQEGIGFAPIDVVFDGTNYWCWDGFHRCAAAAKAGRSEINVEVKQGTLADAQWLSFSANKQHGLPRSDADKWNAVMRALEHDRCHKLSDLQIALHIGVSLPFVCRVRRSLSTYNDSKSDVHTSDDGRVMPEVSDRPADPIDRPAHYTYSAIEPIDAIEAWELGFHLGNVVKYIARAGRKGSEIQDLKKARWYLDRAIKHLEQETTA